MLKIKAICPGANFTDIQNKTPGLYFNINKIDLRVPAIHEAEKQWYFTFCLIFLPIHDV